MHKSTEEIINGQLDIKLGYFMAEELASVFKKSKAEKLQNFMKYLLKYGRQGNLITSVFDYARLCINKTLEK